MNAQDCDAFRDRLPALVAGSLTPAAAAVIEGHLKACAGCREEYDLVRMVRAVRPPIPQGLEGRIQERVRRDFGSPAEVGLEDQSAGILPFRRHIPTWVLSAAAVLVLALGTSVIWNGDTEDAFQDPMVVADGDPPPEAWLWDDGMVAGAPVFDGLTDEDIEALLADFEGGA